MKKYFINVQGGTGLNVSLTQVISELTEKNPDYYEFNVMSPYSDLYQCCNGVSNVYTPNQAREFLFDAKAENAEIVLPEGWSRLLLNTIQEVTIDFDNKRGRQVIILWDEQQKLASANFCRRSREL